MASNSNLDKAMATLAVLGAIEHVGDREAAAVERFLERVASHDDAEQLRAALVVVGARCVVLSSARCHPDQGN